MNASAFFENMQVFCDNPRCLLHLAPDAPNVRESGNWALLPSGLFVGRQPVGTQMLCDFCARGDTLHPAFFYKS